MMVQNMIEKIMLEEIDKWWSVVENGYIKAEIKLYITTRKIYYNILKPLPPDVEDMVEEIYDLPKEALYQLGLYY